MGDRGLSWNGKHTSRGLCYLPVGGARTPTSTTYQHYLKARHTEVSHFSPHNKPVHITVGASARLCEWSGSPVRPCWRGVNIFVSHSTAAKRSAPGLLAEASNHPFDI